MATHVPDESFVIRYGEKFKVEDLMVRALTHYMAKREFGLSVNTLADSSPEEIAAVGERPNSKFRYTTAREIRAIGLTFSDQVDDDGHTDVLFPDPPTRKQFEDFVRVFDSVGINPNPVPPSERGKPHDQR